MKSKNVLAAFLLSFVALYGCTAPSDEAEEEAEQSEDELALRRGSVDHAAIVEGTTMMLAGGPIDPILDPYNQEDPFTIRSAYFERTFARRLANFDAYDRQTDWTEDQARAWSARMASGNYQVVDVSKPCDFANPHTYLEIERAKLTGREHATCGGRMPNEDALDVTLNFLVRGPSASAEDEEALHDGVDAPTKWATPSFPFLAEMNGL